MLLFQISYYDVFEAVLDTLVVLSIFAMGLYILLVPVRTQHRVAHLLHLDHRRHHYHSA